MEGKRIFYVPYFYLFIHISVNIILKIRTLFFKYVTLRHKNGVYFESCKNPQVLLKIQWIRVMLINLSVKRNFRGTCSSVQMQKRTWSEKVWEHLI